MKYNFNTVTTYWYTDDLHSDNHHCTLITLHYIVMNVKLM